MHLKRKSLIGTILTSVILIAMPIAKADFTIVNNTNNDSTSVINNGACSTILGSAGITKAHTTNVVPQRLVNFACTGNPSHCPIDVYMNDNCSGPKVSTLAISTSSGIIPGSIQNSSNYSISGNGFTAQINGGNFNLLKKLFG